MNTYKEEKNIFYNRYIPNFNEFKNAVQIEIENAQRQQDSNTFLRSNSGLVSILKYISYTYHKTYFSFIIGPALDDILNCNIKQSINIRKSGFNNNSNNTKSDSNNHSIHSSSFIINPEDSTLQNSFSSDINNKNYLNILTETIIRRLFYSLDLAPKMLRSCCSYIIKEIEFAFPNDKKLSNKVIGNLLFLRLFSPILIKPELIDRHPHTKETLISGLSIAKLLKVYLKSHSTNSTIKLSIIQSQEIVDKNENLFKKDNNCLIMIQQFIQNFPYIPTNENIEKDRCSKSSCYLITELKSNKELNFINNHIKKKIQSNMEFNKEKCDINKKIKLIFKSWFEKIKSKKL